MIRGPLPFTRPYTCKPRASGDDPEDGTVIGCDGL